MTEKPPGELPNPSNETCVNDTNDALVSEKPVSQTSKQKKDAGQAEDSQNEPTSDQKEPMLNQNEATTTDRAGEKNGTGREKTLSKKPRGWALVRGIFGKSSSKISASGAGGQPSTASTEKRRPSFRRLPSTKNMIPQAKPTASAKRRKSVKRINAEALSYADTNSLPKGVLSIYQNRFDPNAFEARVKVGEEEETMRLAFPEQYPFKGPEVSFMGKTMRFVSGTGGGLSETELHALELQDIYLVSWTPAQRAVDAIVASMQLENQLRYRVREQEKEQDPMERVASASIMIPNSDVDKHAVTTTELVDTLNNNNNTNKPASSEDKKKDAVPTKVSPRPLADS